MARRRNPEWDPTVVAELLRSDDPEAALVLSDYLQERGVEEVYTGTDDPWEDLVNGVGRTIWVAAWADYVEEEGHEALDRPRNGGAWEDYAPETPMKAFEVAEKRIVEKIVTRTQIMNLAALAAAAAHKERNAAIAWVRFASDLGMQALGHGVGIADDFDDEMLDLDVPWIEFHVETDIDDQTLADLMPDVELHDVEIEFEAFFPPDVSRMERESGVSLHVRNGDFTYIEWDALPEPDDEEAIEAWKETPVVRRELGGELRYLFRGRHVDEHNRHTTGRDQIVLDSVTRYAITDPEHVRNMILDACRAWFDWHQGDEQMVRFVGD